LIEEGGDRVAEIPLEKTHYAMRPHEWRVPAAWAGTAVRLHIVDEDPRGLVAIDDLWLVPPAGVE
jgi:hypothetical protein